MSMKNSNDTIGSQTRATFQLVAQCLNQMSTAKKWLWFFQSTFGGDHCDYSARTQTKPSYTIACSICRDVPRKLLGARNTSEGRLLKYWYRYKRLIKVNTNCHNLTLSEYLYCHIRSLMEYLSQILASHTYCTTNKIPLLSQIIYSCKTLYMFRTVFPSIIRSSKLHIQQRYMSNSCCYLLLSGMSSPIAAGSSSCLTYTVVVYAVLSSWWWTERPSETCRAFYKNK